MKDDEKGKKRKKLNELKQHKSKKELLDPLCSIQYNWYLDKPEA